MIKKGVGKQKLKIKGGTLVKGVGALKGEGAVTYLRVMDLLKTRLFH